MDPESLLQRIIGGGQPAAGPDPPVRGSRIARALRRIPGIRALVPDAPPALQTEGMVDFAKQRRRGDMMGRMSMAETGTLDPAIRQERIQAAELAGMATVPNVGAKTELSKSLARERGAIRQAYTEMPKPVKIGLTVAGSLGETFGTAKVARDLTRTALGHSPDVPAPSERLQSLEQQGIVNLPTSAKVGAVLGGALLGPTGVLPVKAAARGLGATLSGTRIGNALNVTGRVAAGRSNVLGGALTGAAEGVLTDVDIGLGTQDMIGSLGIGTGLGLLTGGVMPGVTALERATEARAAAREAARVDNVVEGAMSRGQFLRRAAILGTGAAAVGAGGIASRLARNAVEPLAEAVAPARAVDSAIRLPAMTARNANRRVTLAHMRQVMDQATGRWRRMTEDEAHRWVNEGLRREQAGAASGSRRPWFDHAQEAMDEQLGPTVRRAQPLPDDAQGLGIFSRPREGGFLGPEVGGETGQQILARPVPKTPKIRAPGEGGFLGLRADGAQSELMGDPVRRAMVGGAIGGAVGAVAPVDVDGREFFGPTTSDLDIERSPVLDVVARVLFGASAGVAGGYGLEAARAARKGLPLAGLDRVGMMEGKAEGKVRATISKGNRWSIPHADDAESRAMTIETLRNEMERDGSARVNWHIRDKNGEGDYFSTVSMRAVAVPIEPGNPAAGIKHIVASIDVTDSSGHYRRMDRARRASEGFDREQGPLGFRGAKSALVEMTRAMREAFHPHKFQWASDNRNTGDAIGGITNATSRSLRIRGERVLGGEAARSGEALTAAERSPTFAGAQERRAAAELVSTRREQMSDLSGLVDSSPAWLREQLPTILDGLDPDLRRPFELDFRNRLIWSRRAPEDALQESIRSIARRGTPLQGESPLFRTRAFDAPSPMARAMGRTVAELWEMPLPELLASLSESRAARRQVADLTAAIRADDDVLDNVFQAVRSGSTRNLSVEDRRALLAGLEEAGDGDLVRVIRTLQSTNDRQLLLAVAGTGRNADLLSRAMPEQFNETVLRGGRAEVSNQDLQRLANLAIDEHGPVLAPTLAFNFELVSQGGYLTGDYRRAARAIARSRRVDEVSMRAPGGLEPLVRAARTEDSYLDLIEDIVQRYEAQEGPPVTMTGGGDTWGPGAALFNRANHMTKPELQELANTLRYAPGYEGFADAIEAMARDVDEFANPEDWAAMGRWLENMGGRAGQLHNQGRRLHAAMRSAAYRGRLDQATFGYDLAPALNYELQRATPARAAEGPAIVEALLRYFPTDQNTLTHRLPRYIRPGVEPEVPARRLQRGGRPLDELRLRTLHDIEIGMQDSVADVLDALESGRALAWRDPHGYLATELELSGLNNGEIRSVLDMLEDAGAHEEHVQIARNMLSQRGFEIATLRRSIPEEVAERATVISRELDGMFTPLQGRMQQILDGAHRASSNYTVANDAATSSALGATARARRLATDLRGIGHPDFDELARELEFELDRVAQRAEENAGAAAVSREEAAAVAEGVAQDAERLAAEGGLRPMADQINSLRDAPIPPGMTGEDVGAFLDEMYGNLAGSPNARRSIQALRGLDDVAFGEVPFRRAASELAFAVQEGHIDERALHTMFSGMPRTTDGDAFRLAMAEELGSGVSHTLLDDLRRYLSGPEGDSDAQELLMWMQGWVTGRTFASSAEAGELPYFGSQIGRALADQFPADRPIQDIVRLAQYRTMYDGGPRVTTFFEHLGAELEYTRGISPTDTRWDMPLAMGRVAHGEAGFVQREALGGLAGGALGAASGAAVAPEGGRLEGAVIGGAVGAAIGAATPGRALGRLRNSREARSAFLERAEDVANVRAQEGGSIGAQSTVINFSKLALDPTAEQSLRVEAEKLVTSGELTREAVTHSQVREAARELGLSEKFISDADLRPATDFAPEELVALQHVIKQDVEALGALEDQLGKEVASMSEQEIDAAQRVASVLQGRIDRMVSKLSLARSDAGRRLNALRIMAQAPMSYEQWIERAARALSRESVDDIKLVPDEVKHRVRELVNRGDRDGLAEYVDQLYGSSVGEQVATWWKAGLLTSPTTHAANILGNTTMAVLEQVKDVPAYFADRLLSRATGIDTKGLATPRRVAQAAAVGSKRGIADLKRVIAGDATDFDVFRKADQYRQVLFSTPSEKLNSWLNAYTKSVFGTLEAEDAYFKQLAIARSLQEQADVFARAGRGDADELLKAPTDEMMLTAIEDAELSTFTNRGFLAAVAGAAQQAARSKSAVGSTVLEFVAPFKRTPANVATRVVEYSPFGYLMAVPDAVKLYRVAVQNQGDEILSQKMRRLQRRVANTSGRASVGSVPIALGYLLAQRGLITTGYPGPGRERNRFQQSNRQENSVLVNGKWLSIERISPVGNLMVFGAHLHEQGQNPDAVGGVLGAAASGAGQLAQTVREQSFMRGVQEAIQATEDPGRFAARYARSTAASFVVPNVVRRSAFMVDPVMRETEGGAMGVGNEIQSRIPFLSKGLQPRLDRFGEDRRRARTTFEQSTSLFDPFNMRTDLRQTDGLVGELDRVGASVPNLVEPGSFRDLPPGEMRERMRARGQATRAVAEQAIASDEYQQAHGMAKALVETDPEYLGRDVETVTTELQRDIIEGAMRKARSAQTRFHNRFPEMDAEAVLDLITSGGN